jgi:hypothetical protein
MGRRHFFSHGRVLATGIVLSAAIASTLLWRQAAPSAGRLPTAEELNESFIAFAPR